MSAVSNPGRPAKIESRSREPGTPEHDVESMSASVPTAGPQVPEPSEPPRRLDELTALGSAFRHVFRTLSRLRGRDTHLGGSELSHAQFELLLELDERGELSAGELALAARLAPGTVTQMPARRPTGAWWSRG
jgi:hypothetical protein